MPTVSGRRWLLPEATPNDGLLDVAVLMPPKRRDWVPPSWALIRRPPTAPVMETFQARHAEISSDRYQPRELDGKLIAPSDTLTAAVRLAALWVGVPQPPSAGTSTSNEDIRVRTMFPA